MKAWVWVVGVVLTLLPPVGVWLYMQGRVDAAFARGKATCEQQHAADVVTAIEERDVESAARDARILAAARADAGRIASELAAARSESARLQQEIENHARTNPLPADCRADPERVRAVNAARRAAAGSAAP